MHILDAGLAHSRQSGHRALPAAPDRGGRRAFGTARPLGILPFHDLLDICDGFVRPAYPSGYGHPAKGISPGAQPLALCPQPCRAMAGTLCRSGGKRRGADAAHTRISRPPEQRGRHRRGGGVTVLLPKQLQLNDFTVEHYPNGTPCHFFAEISIDGKPARLEVNHPYAAS